MPSEVETGQNIVSGSINLTGVLKVQTTKLFDDSTVAKILELVENASSRKAKAEAFITRFARVYTPVVVAFAAILAVLPPLFLGGWSTWIYRACSFLVVSCPCALVISVPLSFFGGLGAASRQGILIKGSNYLEAMGSLDTAVFDKTGTLTTGKFEVTDVSPVRGRKEELLELAALGEYNSNHPIAQSVKQAYGKEADTNRIGQVEEISGHGIHAQVQPEAYGPAGSRCEHASGSSGNDTVSGGGDNVSWFHCHFRQCPPGCFGYAGRSEKAGGQQSGHADRR